MGTAFKIGGTPRFRQGEAPSFLSLSEQGALQAVWKEGGSFNVVLHLFASFVFKLP